MIELAKQFRWFIPKGGFEIFVEHDPEQSSEDQQPDAVLREVKSPVKLDSYRVWDDPTLYLRFAGLPVHLDDLSWMAFANQYGSLRMHGKMADYDLKKALVAPYVQDDPVLDEQVRKEAYRRESRSDWERENEILDLAVSAWRKILAGDPDALEIGALDVMIDTGLRRDTVPVLTHDAPDAEGSYQIVPTSLLGALWMQFAEHVRIRAHYKPCEVCGHEFAVPPDKRSKTRKYCSAACKTKQWERRKKDG